MGIAGKSGPTHVVPTVLYRQERDRISALSHSGVFQLSSSLSQLPITCIGNDAIRESINAVSGSTKPIVDGRVNDWSDLEQFLACGYSQYLRVDPTERPCVLTEPPLNPASNREKLAEVMFETFGVPSMYIGIQAVLALYAYWDGRSAVTGTVVDSGDGVTHVIPVTDGYIDGSCVREIPIAGKDVTRIISDALQARKEVIVENPETAVSLNRLAKQVKEKLAYVCQDPVKELRLFDANASSCFKKISWTDPRSNAARDCEIGYEQFLGPEVFFQPALVSASVTQSLPMIVVDAIQASPIDYRKGLLSNVVLSGGSTLFPHFGSRLETEVVALLNKGSTATVRVNSSKPEVQRFAVWNGASVLTQTPQFNNMLMTKKDYFEHGPSRFRETTITRSVGL